MAKKQFCNHPLKNTLGLCTSQATVKRGGKLYCWRHDPERQEATAEAKRAARFRDPQSAGESAEIVTRDVNGELCAYDVYCKDRGSIYYRCGNPGFIKLCIMLYADNQRGTALRKVTSGDSLVLCKQCVAKLATDLVTLLSI